MFRMKRKEKTHIGFKDIRQLIKKQTSRFPISRTFDYTQVIKDGSMDLGLYFEPQLVEFIDTATRSTNSSKEKSSMLYEDLRCSRVRMIIALLCFTMNPQCCFIQTIVGLVLCIRPTGQGIWFTKYNGCTCSIDHIRSHGSYWASRHIPTVHLNTKKFWRITIDNLNFYLKFAKSLSESSSGAKKMLNLLTGQVTHQVSTEITTKKRPLR